MDLWPKELVIPHVRTATMRRWTCNWARPTRNGFIPPTCHHRPELFALPALVVLPWYDRGSCLRSHSPSSSGARAFLGMAHPKGSAYSGARCIPVEHGFPRRRSGFIQIAVSFFLRHRPRHRRNRRSRRDCIRPECSPSSYAVVTPSHLLSVCHDARAPSCTWPSAT